MILSEAGTGPVLPPLAAYKEHLRLSHGFGDEGGEDALLSGYLAAAVAVIERRTGRALGRRAFSLAVSRLGPEGCVVLPVGPVETISDATLEAGGAATPLDVSGWSVAPGSTRQAVSRSGAPLPSVPPGGVLRLGFDAGLAADWDGVPADLAQAVMMLAADFHARRGTERDGDEGLPAPVIALTAPWRPARL
ncbi:MAG: hypothetical protein AAFQ88_09500 [Pseudomonadota bacterium]